MTPLIPESCWRQSNPIPICGIKDKQKGSMQTQQVKKPKCNINIGKSEPFRNFMHHQW